MLVVVPLLGATTFAIFGSSVSDRLGSTICRVLAMVRPEAIESVFERSCGSCRIEPGAYLLKGAVVSARLEVLVTADRG